MLKVHPYSHATAKLRMLPPTKEKQHAPVGTCFFYRSDDITYLITNGHNVTGCHPETKQKLPGFIYYPSFLSINLLYIHEECEGYIKKNFLVPLYKDTDSWEEPQWLIHPQYGYQVDVIAIPINAPENVKIFPINEYPTLTDMKEQPSDDVFIIGYPIPLDETIDLPIWKRGSIASEPEYKIDGLPKFLIDTATRPGMSGSPVISRRKTWEIEQRLESITLMQEKFLGIYSGRIGGSDEFQAQLGIVWHKRVIEEIVESNKKSSTDFMFW